MPKFLTNKKVAGDTAHSRFGKPRQSPWRHGSTELSELLNRHRPVSRHSDGWRLPRWSDHTDPLRAAAWSEEQLAEAVYIVAMFAFCNRVADAFGIEPMGYLAMGGVSK